MSKLELDATVENLPKVLEFIDSKLEELECSMKIQMQIDVSVEELFVNIAHYAYTDSIGKAEIVFDVHDDPRTIEISFIDSGVPYDPLAKDDPDISLSAEERSIGGLGIFMVKKNMDDIKYEYTNGCNITSIFKLI